MDVMEKMNKEMVVVMVLLCSGSALVWLLLYPYQTQQPAAVTDQPVVQPVVVPQPAAQNVTPIIQPNAADTRKGRSSETLMAYMILVLFAMFIITSILHTYVRMKQKMKP